VTGLLYNGFGSEAARVFTHDVAGWAMIPFAVALLALEMWYVNRLFVEVEDIDPRELMRQRSRVPAH
jgi:hypothetical protein